MYTCILLKYLARFFSQLCVCIWTRKWDYCPCTLYTHIYMRIILTIHLSVLSHTSVYAFAESPGVRVCHADYALGPTTLLCNAMQCEMQCIHIALCCTHCNPRKHLSVRMSVNKRPQPLSTNTQLPISKRCWCQQAPCLTTHFRERKISSFPVS